MHLPHSTVSATGQLSRGYGPLPGSIYEVAVNMYTRDTGGGASINIQRQLDVHGGELRDQVLEDVGQSHPLDCAAVATEPAVHLAAPTAACGQNAPTSGTRIIDTRIRPARERSSFPE